MEKNRFSGGDGFKRFEQEVKTQLRIGAKGKELRAANAQLVTWNSWIGKSRRRDSAESPCPAPLILEIRSYYDRATTHVRDAGIVREMKKVDDPTRPGKKISVQNDVAAAFRDLFHGEVKDLAKWWLQDGAHRPTVKALWALYVSCIRLGAETYSVPPGTIRSQAPNRIDNPLDVIQRTVRSGNMLDKLREYAQEAKVKNKMPRTTLVKVATIAESRAKENFENLAKIYDRLIENGVRPPAAEKIVCSLAASVIWPSPDYWKINADHYLPKLIAEVSGR